jgi:hypothetical protein
LPANEFEFPPAIDIFCGSGGTHEGGGPGLAAMELDAVIQRALVKSDYEQHSSEARGHGTGMDQEGRGVADRAMQPILDPLADMRARARLWQGQAQVVRNVGERQCLSVRRRATTI